MDVEQQENVPHDFAMTEEFSSVARDFVTTSTTPSSVPEVGVFTTPLLATQFVTAPLDNFPFQTPKTIVLPFSLEVIHTLFTFMTFHIN